MVLEAARPSTPKSLDKPASDDSKSRTVGEQSDDSSWNAVPLNREIQREIKRFATCIRVLVASTCHPSARLSALSYPDLLPTSQWSCLFTTKRYRKGDNVMFFD